MGCVDESTVGDTPLIEVETDAPPRVFATVEWFNLYACDCGGSLKARIAARMLDRAGDAVGDRTLLEPSSGNTGRALARIGGARGHDVRVVMPADAARGKIWAVRDAGAAAELVPATGYDAIIERAAALLEAHPERFHRLNQYENPGNPNAHAAGTAAELRAQAPELTHVVAGVGTGGTLTGLARELPDDVTRVAVEPARPGHGIGGLKYLRGDAHHPETYEAGRADRTVYVETATAHRRVRALRERYADRRVRVVDPGQHGDAVVRRHLRTDGDLLPGPSSGAVLAAVRQLAHEGALDADDAVGVVFGDRGDVYPRAPLR